MANSILSVAGTTPVNLSSLLLPSTSGVVRATKPEWLKKNTVTNSTVIPSKQREDVEDIQEEDLRSRTVTSLEKRKKRPSNKSSPPKKTSVRKTLKKQPTKKPTKKPIKKKNKKNNKRK